LVGIGGGLQAQSGEREHVDQPTGAAGDTVDAQNCIEFAVDSRAGAAEPANGGPLELGVEDGAAVVDQPARVQLQPPHPLGAAGPRRWRPNR
jgi:hypothetical protein